MAVVLFLVTGFRTIHFNFTLLPQDTFFLIIAAAAVFAIDGGTLFWSDAWKNHSAGEWQDKVALIMFVVDIVAMLATSVVDTLLFVTGPIKDNPEIIRSMESIAVWVIPAIVVLNVAAVIIYEMVSEEVNLFRSKRQADAEVESIREQMRQDEEVLKHKENLLQLKQQLAETDMALSAVEGGLERAKIRGEHVKDAEEQFAKVTKDRFAKRVRERIKALSLETISSNGNGNGNGSKDAADGKLPN